jgi:hypothetical protein
MNKTIRIIIYNKDVRVIYNGGHAIIIFVKYYNSSF